MQEGNAVCSLFGEFVNAHCRLRQGAWVELTMLHVAFADFCVLRGAGVEWVNENVCTLKSQTLSLAVKHGGIRKGSKVDCVVIAGVELVTYPY